jgi:hypothetical protein
MPNFKNNFKTEIGLGEKNASHTQNFAVQYPSHATFPLKKFFLYQISSIYYCPSSELRILVHNYTLTKLIMQYTPINCTHPQLYQM